MLIGRIYFPSRILAMSRSVDVIRAKISSAYLLMVSFLLISALGGLIYRSIDVGWQAIQLPTLATMGI
jgi:hypothetical protein